MTNFIDHDMDVSDSVKVVIRKDEWIASRPWHADLVFPDGHVWTGWQQFYRTKKSLIADALAAAPRAEIVDA